MADAITSKDWTVIKARVFNPKLNFYGLLIVFFDNKKKFVENVSLVFSIYSETHDLQLSDSWDKFEKKIQDMVFGGNFSQSVTINTADKLKADMSLSAFAAELYDNIAKSDASLVASQLKHLFSKTLNDTNFEINCEIEGVSSTELAKGRVREPGSAEASVAATGIETPPEYRLVKAKLILAPIDGKLITDLREGDSIMLNLIPVSMAENNILDKLKLRRPDGTARPVPAKVIKIKSYGKGWQLLLHIMENYYAKIVEEEKILLKTGPETSTAQPGKNEALRQAGQKEKSAISWIAVAIVILLGVVITYFVFLNG